MPRQQRQERGRWPCHCKLVIAVALIGTCSAKLQELVLTEGYPESPSRLLRGTPENWVKLGLCFCPEPPCFSWEEEPPGLRVYKYINLTLRYCFPEIYIFTAFKTSRFFYLFSWHANIWVYKHVSFSLMTSSSHSCNDCWLEFSTKREKDNRKHRLTADKISEKKRGSLQ